VGTGEQRDVNLTAAVLVGSGLAFLLGVVALLIVFWDTFETIVLPRTVRRKVRLTNLVYQAAWSLVSRAARRMTPGGGARRSLLGAYGPLSLLLLVGVWTTGLVFGFALINFGLKSPVNAPETSRDFGTYLYASGVTLFTLGFGDVTPTTALARFLSVLEAGVGIGYFAIVISYLPVMYGEFSRREVNILLLDARAGSPPAASELLRRHGRTDGLDPNLDALTSLLKDFERWSAELLESYISYPILSFYRSQHEQQSWLGALTTILDTCALVRVGSLEQGGEVWQKPLAWQARLTFALARHVLVDLAYLLNVPPLSNGPDRLPAEEWRRLCATLTRADLPLLPRGAAEDDNRAETVLRDLRREYEPFVAGLARYLLLSVPPWNHPENTPDNWQTSAWDDGDKSAVHF
jgi:hypothetical protein